MRCKVVIPSMALAALLNDTLADTSFYSLYTH